ncbi:MAG: hypothetical protein JW922_06975 [Paludibacteraceae bacterium]|nr:hypothetical protein [Paludibacteraceae bacterium]
MKDLYVWLQQEVQESIELLDNEIITDEVQKTVFSSSKEYLEKSKPVLEKLITVLAENELDVMTLINLIAKLKAKTSDSDEDEILQSMILKMLEISSLNQTK